MSGITGAIFEHARADLVPLLDTMSATLGHRGGTETRVVFEERFALAARSDPHGGFQASLDVDPSYITAFDGWLSNADELKNRFGLERTADCARIVSTGYRHEGMEVLRRLRGSFSFLIAHRDGSDEILLARDMFARRPLYYAIQGERFWFGSEFKAILQDHNFARQIASETFPQILAYGASMGPDTPFRDLWKVVPGQYVIGVPWRRLVSGWYCLPEEAELRDREEDEWAVDVWDILNGAIRCDYRQSPGRAVLLSGGVDSSLLAVALSEGDGERHSAVNIGAPGWEKDEVDSASETASRCGLGMSSIRIAPEDGIRDALASAIWKLEEPTRFYNAIPLEIACSRLAGCVRGLFTGEGADAILGTQSNERAHWVARLNNLPRWTAGGLRKMPKALLRVPRLGPVLGNFRELLGRYDSVATYTLESFLFSPEIMGPTFARTVPAHLKELAAHVAHWPGDAQDMLLYLLGLGYCWNERFEKIAAHAGIDIFSPFETYEMLSLSLQMPLHRKVTKQGTKPILRRLVADKLSPQIPHRRKIQLSAPMKMWWNESRDLRDAVMKLGDTTSPAREYLDVEVMDRALRMYEAGPVEDARLSRALFTMLSLDLWLEMFNTRARVAA